MVSGVPMVIIADDDIDDRLLLTEALVENGVERSRILLACDGEELLSLLAEYSHTPSIIFLDLNMPKKNGLKTLEAIRANPTQRHIPVLIFTTSNSRSDILSSYDLGCNAYFEKPYSYSELVDMVGVIKSYWFEKATLIKPDFAELPRRN
ncbi:MAG TPA: response regulator [Cyclobacteriaceae bacterium]|jgi:CheY-like chemotaxis protein